MTRIVDLAAAEARLSQFVDRAAAGEEIIIAKAGEPVARLTALPERAPRRPGAAAHWRVPDDVFLEPADPRDLDAAETDALSIAER